MSADPFASFTLSVDILAYNLLSQFADELQTKFSSDEHKQLVSATFHSFIDGVVNVDHVKTALSMSNPESTTAPAVFQPTVPTEPLQPAKPKAVVAKPVVAKTKAAAKPNATTTATTATATTTTTTTNTVTVDNVVDDTKPVAVKKAIVKKPVASKTVVATPAATPATPIKKTSVVAKTPNSVKKKSINGPIVADPAVKVEFDVVSHKFVVQGTKFVVTSPEDLVVIGTLHGRVMRKLTAATRADAEKLGLKTLAAQPAKKAGGLTPESDDDDSEPEDSDNLLSMHTGIISEFKDGEKLLSKQVAPVENDE